MNPTNVGCASPTTCDDWNSINWKKVERGVKSLQSRIVKAVKQKHFHRAKYFKTKGNRNWVFAAEEKGKTFELPLFEAAKIRRHVKIRNNSNPYDREWESYFKERMIRGKTTPKNLKESRLA